MAVKKAPNVFSLRSLVDRSSPISPLNTLAGIDGEWVPARPINWKHRSLWEKLVEAFAVFMGTAEAFYWPKGQ